MTGKFIAVEIDPPSDADASFLMEAARIARAAGADAITLADNPFARARADSAILACKLRRETGIRAIPHLTCRDRNYNALKSTLLGLAIEGVDAVLAVTGDPVRPEDSGIVRTRASFDAATLAGFISGWNRDEFPRPFTVAAALNVNAPSFPAELARARKKAALGASALFTQPVLGERAARNLRLARESLPREVALVAGILPVVSGKNAEYLNARMRGISVDASIANRYVGASREECGELAVSISLSMMDLVADSVDGYCLITPFKRIDLIESILSRAGAGARPRGGAYLSLAM